ncbi:FliH/SctL family protein [Cupriavidus basilensis]
MAANFRQALAGVDQEVSRRWSRSLDVARQLVRAKVEDDPEVLLPAVRELLTSEPVLSGSPCLLLHPEDVALVRKPPLAAR